MQFLTETPAVASPSTVEHERVRAVRCFRGHASAVAVRCAWLGAITILPLVGILSLMQIQHFASQETFQRSALFGLDTVRRGLASEDRAGGFIGWAAEGPGEHYRPVVFTDMPSHLQNAIVGIEDHRFFNHVGVDVIGVARAAAVNLWHGRVVQGGSTITQQLVRMRLLSAERTLARKVKEGWLALLLERHYTKPEILEAYVNSVYLGKRSGIVIRGVGAAAEAYFGKSVRQLTLSESAMLAALLQAPNRHSPEVNPKQARMRRNVVLRRMHQLGMLTDTELAKAQAAKLRVVKYARPQRMAPHFRDYVSRDVRRLVAQSKHEGGGARVRTTLDLSLQELAERAISETLPVLERQLKGITERQHELQVALVALDAHTGDIRAMVGSRDYAQSAFNRATHARRQPGSAFKPFVYAAALTGSRPVYQPDSLIEDAPIMVKAGTEMWRPRNFEDRYHGLTTVRSALERSMNAATLRIAERVGYESIIATARRMGVSAPLRASPMIALGAFEITPLELVRAYVPFANGGVRPAVMPSVYITERGWRRHDVATDERVLSITDASRMTEILRDVVRTGRRSGVSRPSCTDDFAGKTGTTNDGRDAWFVGYSSSLVTAVWVGFDTGSSYVLSGGRAAAPIWFSFMCRAVALR